MRRCSICREFVVGISYERLLSAFGQQQQVNVYVFAAYSKQYRVDGCCQLAISALDVTK